MSLSYKRKLIDMVEANPDLWKMTKKAPNLKQRLWNDVGSELGTSGFDARRQWEILRDQFRREYKRFIHNNNYESKWILYNRMLFVRHAIRTKDGVPAYQSNSDNEEHAAEEQQADKITADQWDMLALLPKIQVRQDLQGNACVSVPQEHEREPSTSAGVSSSCQRPRYDDGELSPVRRRRHWDSEETDDEDYHFVMSILPSLRSLQQIKKLRIRSKIMELIAAELDADAGSSHTSQRLSNSSEPEEKYNVAD